jgi:hypothetical protein
MQVRAMRAPIHIQFQQDTAVFFFGLFNGRVPVVPPIYFCHYLTPYPDRKFLPDPQAGTGRAPTAAASFRPCRLKHQLFKDKIPRAKGKDQGQPLSPCCLFPGEMV